MTTIATVDVGGSFIKLGLVDGRGRLRSRAQLAFLQRADFAAIAEAVAAELRTLARDAPRGGAPALIGVALPGYVNARTGVLDSVGNVPALRGHSLSAALGRALRLPAYAENDGVCALLAELAHGVGRKARHFALLTLGTGVGGGLVVEGAPLRGSQGTQPELGHLCLEPQGRRCVCGNRGCLERYVGGPALLRTYAAVRRGGPGCGARPRDAEAVFRLAARGDRAAERAVALLCERLAQGLGLLINVVRLEAIVLGGGLAQAGPALLEPVRAALPRYVWPGRDAGLTLHLSALGNDGGLLGAAAMARQRHAERRTR